MEHFQQCDFLCNKGPCNCEYIRKQIGIAAGTGNNIGNRILEPKKFNKMPEGQGKRDIERPRYDFIPLEFLDELAGIFEEGRRPRPELPEGYGDSWKKGGEVFLRDCLNHALWHLMKYINGDRSENHLSKVAWGCLVVKWHQSQPLGSHHEYQSKGPLGSPCEVCGMDCYHIIHHRL